MSRCLMNEELIILIYSNIPMVTFITLLEHFNTVNGIFFNSLLLYAIWKFSNPKLGAYKQLIGIFTIADACLVVLHALVLPRSILVGSKHGVVTDTIFDDRRDDQNDVVLIFTFLFINILMTTSLILVSSLASLTFYHIRRTYQISSKAGQIQKKLLIALCAQASVPTVFVYIPYLVTINIPFWRVNITVLHDFGPQFTTCFPVLDAIVVILLITDYRKGLVGMIRMRKEQPAPIVEQFTSAA